MKNASFWKRLIARQVAGKYYRITLQNTSAPKDTIDQMVFPKPKGMIDSPNDYDRDFVEKLCSIVLRNLPFS